MEPRRTFEEIKTIYPDEWVYVLDPTYTGIKLNEGTVLVHHPDKRTAIELAKNERANFKNQIGTLIYAGNLIPINRSWIHGTRLS